MKSTLSFKECGNVRHHSDMWIVQSKIDYMILNYTIQKQDCLE